MQSPKAIWENTLKVLKREMTSVSYNTWIKDLEPLAIDNNTLVLQAQNERYRTTLTSLYCISVAEAVNSANDTHLEVMFVVPSERSRYIGADGKPQAMMLNPKYTFDSFVIGESNRFAHAAAKAVAEAPGEAYNPLFVYGGVGLGKTHLMHAIGQYIKSRTPNANISYITSETFTNELIQSIQDNKNASFRSRYRNVDVLMVDDIQFIAGKGTSEQEFFHTFNALKDSAKQIIITSDKPPRDIPMLEERLRSRFEGGLIADIKAPDFETRLAILRKKASQEEVAISDEVLAFIAENVISNIRELEGSLNRVMAYSLLTKLPADINLAHTALKDIVMGTEGRHITPELIQQVVSDYFQISVRDIASKRKDHDIAFPRQIAMYITREFTDCPLKKIGDFYGGRHYSTVIYACDKLAQDILSDHALQETVENIIKRIKM